MPLTLCSSTGTNTLSVALFGVSPAVHVKFHPGVSPLTFRFILRVLFRAGSDEIDGQKAGKNGHHAGSAEAAHPAAGPAASCPGGSPDSSTSHTR